MRMKKLIIKIKKNDNIISVYLFNFIEQIFNCLFL